MKHFKYITVFENRRRIKVLTELRKSCEIYFSESQKDFMGSNRIENDKSRQARKVINTNLNEINWIIRATGISPDMTYTSAPVAGGQTYHFDVLANIFNIHHYEIAPDTIFDFIDQSLGIYEKNSRSSKIRTYNPFFWIWLAIEYIASIPFKLISTLGFDSNKIELSRFGRFIKGIFQIIISISAFLTILNLLGLLEKFKNYLFKLF